MRAILRDALDRGLIAKYVVADRIESISLRYSFPRVIGVSSFFAEKGTDTNNLLTPYPPCAALLSCKRDIY